MFRGTRAFVDLFIDHVMSNGQLMLVSIAGTISQDRDRIRFDDGSNVRERNLARGLQDLRGGAMHSVKKSTFG